MLGVTKRTASRYTTKSDFPRPIARLAMGPIWRTAEVERWAREHMHFLEVAHLGTNGACARLAWPDSHHR